MNITARMTRPSYVNRHHNTVAMARSAKPTLKTLRCTRRSFNTFLGSILTPEPPKIFQKAEEPKTEPPKEVDACDIEAIRGRMRKLNTEEKVILNRAISVAHKNLNKTIKHLEEKHGPTLERMKVFFDKDVPADGVAAGLRLIKARLSKVKKLDEFHIDPSDDRCATRAFTRIPPSAAQPVYPQIFIRKQILADSPVRLARTLIHEAAHSVLRVIDVPLSDGHGAYGAERATSLAIGPSSKWAIQNADNWALFVNAHGFEGHVENALDYVNHKQA